MTAEPTVFTVGHSTRSAAELLALLREFDLRCLVDVRRYPASRRYPHFAREPLAAALERAGIAYAHEPDLGGRRSPHAGSPNTAWRQPGFRGYADHMATPAFNEALERLRGRAARSTTAVMCAEAVPWRCHRQLLADALLARGHRVLHILAPGQLLAHTLSPTARASAGGVLVYREEGGAQKRLFGSFARSAAQRGSQRKRSRPQ